MNKTQRTVDRIITPGIFMEGAGVKLKRSIGTAELDYLDPFLLFDHFGSDVPEDYLAGFPMHPHRGIETVTYILSGEVNHKDSLGNSGTIGAGDIQWMTSGSGIMHEEMPQRTDGVLSGFQLWVNLPANLKMTAPRYQEVASATIPEINREDGVSIRVIAGTVNGVSGPVTEIAADPDYIDVSVPSGGVFEKDIEMGHAAFAYVFEGEGVFIVDGGDEKKIAALSLVTFNDGDNVRISAGEGNLRFLLVSGNPQDEPIYRYGPFVMNTRDEIEQALRDLQNGTFVK